MVQNEKKFFELSLGELWFLILSQNVDLIEGCEMNFDCNVEKMKVYAEQLKQKQYLTSDENGKMRVIQSLYDGMYVVTHPISFFSASNETEKINFYFLNNCIVSIQIKKDRCELMSCPFVNIAIGQLASEITEENYKQWKFESRMLDEGDIIVQYYAHEEKNYLDTINNAIQILVPAHGHALAKGGLN